MSKGARVIDFLGKESSRFLKETDKVKKEVFEESKKVFEETKILFVSFEKFIRKEYFIIIVVILSILVLIQIYLILASIWDLSPFFYNRKDISRGNSIYF